MNGKKPFILKRSIGTRIIFLMAVMSFVIVLFSVLYIRRLVGEYAENYYSAIGNVISGLVSSVVNDEDDIRTFEQTDTAKELNRICREYMIHAVWAETSDPPYEKARHLIYITDDSKVTREEIDHLHNITYTLEDAEKEIFTNQREEARLSYVNEKGQRIVGYLHGVYDDGMKCIAVLGVTFDLGEIVGKINQRVMGLTAAVIIIIVILIVVTGIILHFQVFGPLAYISGRMREFIDGGRMDTEKIPVKGENDLSRVAASYNIMTDEIREYVNRVNDLERERLTTEAEMNVAAQIQAGMLPPPVYKDGTLVIEAAMKPAREVAGDFYYYMTLPDEKTFFVIADVSGKGISAALFMAEAVNAIRYNAVLHSSLSDIMYAANNDIYSRNPEKLFVTAFAAVFDPADGTLTYCNAGHEPPYIIGDGRVEIPGGADCLLLGLFGDEEYTDASIKVAPGNELFLYTDGLTETIGPGRSMFGKERLEKELKEYAAGKCEDSLNERMISAAKKFADGAEAFDDLTMMTVRFFGEEK